MTPIGRVLFQNLAWAPISNSRFLFREIPADARSGASPLAMQLPWAHALLAMVRDFAERPAWREGEG